VKPKRIAGDYPKCENPEWPTNGSKAIAHEPDRAGSSASEDLMTSTPSKGFFEKNIIRHCITSCISSVTLFQALNPDSSNTQID
jgi:hypothetical protein